MDVHRRLVTTNSASPLSRHSSFNSSDAKALHSLLARTRAYSHVLAKAKASCSCSYPLRRHPGLLVTLNSMEKLAFFVDQETFCGGDVCGGGGGLGGSGGGGGFGGGGVPCQVIKPRNFGS